MHIAESYVCRFFAFFFKKKFAKTKEKRIGLFSSQTEKYKTSPSENLLAKYRLTSLMSPT